MKSDALIDALVSDLKAVRRLPSAAARARYWSALASVSVASGTWALGTRADLRQRLGQPAFWWEALALLTLSWCAARSAFQLSVPGAADSRHARGLPWLVVLVWLFSIVARYFGGAHDHAQLAGWTCVERMLWLALLPALLLFVMLRKAAAFDRPWTSLLALLAAAALGMLGTQVVCAKDDPTHVLFWHFAPVLVLTLAGGCAGKWLLSGGHAATKPPRSWSNAG